MTKIYLITGFLGAGKSTYLNKLLLNSSKKTGVLINEFGKISVDTITLSSNGIDLVELKNGSIFCSCLKDKFIDGLIELIKMSLDEIYIESSGLADPSNINNIADVIKKQVPDIRFEFSGVICLVDAVYFLKQLDVLESIRRQIQHSHVIIINKIDLVDKDKLDSIQKIISDINPQAKTIRSLYGNYNYSLDKIALFEIASEESTNTVMSRPNNLTVAFENIESIDTINKFLALCSDYLYRAKGYIVVENEIYKVDLVSRTIDIVKLDKDLFIKPEELNKIVLLISGGIKGSRHITQIVNSMSEHSITLTS